MRRVTGIGGIFIKAPDPGALRAWYRKQPGLDIQPRGGVVFRWSAAPFMVNYRIENLHALLATLKEEGYTVHANTEETEQGKLGWVMDPEGNRVELWEPAPEPLAG